MTQVDLEVADECGDEGAFDGLDGVRGEAVEVVPEALTRELSGLDGEQPGDGAVKPSGDACFGARREAAIEDGDEQQVGADGGAGAAFGVLYVALIR